MAERPYPILKWAGEDSVLVEFEEEVSPKINQKVRQLALGIERYPLPGIKEVVLAYRSLMVFFDPFTIDFRKVSDLIETLREEALEIEVPQPRLFKIPTVYGGIYGPDLERVSEQTKLAPNEVIRIFSQQAYLVYCLGFLCGLAYLGGVPKILEAPRLASPRPFVPAGSVGFSGTQANILPIDTPSGFNYIGRTFVGVYNPKNFPPTLIRPGDYVQCISVTEEESKLAGEKDLGDFIIESF
jgi:inhibitor of KinA